MKKEKREQSFLENLSFEDNDFVIARGKRSIITELDNRIRHKLIFYDMLDSSSLILDHHSFIHASPMTKQG